MRIVNELGFFKNCFSKISNNQSNAIFYINDVCGGSVLCIFRTLVCVKE